MYEIISKKTNKPQYVSDVVYDILKANGELKKYNVVGKIAPHKIEPKEIIQKQIKGEAPKLKKNDR